jgi:hypothetical protein
VPQRTLSEALGGAKPLSLSLISSWENENNPTVPTPARLHDYATFFVTERSVAGGRGRLLADDELSVDETAARDDLYRKLLALRTEITDVSTVTSAAPIGFNWRFPRGAVIRIVCGKLDDPLHPYTQPDNLNYTELLTFADADALIELFGHLRKVNPDSDVRYIRSDRLKDADELGGHLILLGGIGLNDLTEQVFGHAGLPISQREHPAFAGQGEIFDVTEGDRTIEFLPEVSGRTLKADLGLLARMPNPNNASTTLTFCNGVFARGVLGAVRTLTDDKLRKENESYLATRFGGAERFAILMRVPVVLGTALTPDLRNESTRLYEWPDNAVPQSSDGLARAGWPASGNT